MIKKQSKTTQQHLVVLCIFNEENEVWEAVYCLLNHGETGTYSAYGLINFLTFLGKDIKMVVPCNLYLGNIMKEEKASFYKYTSDKLGRIVQQYGGSWMKYMVKSI